MKKVLCVLLTAFLLIGFSACNNTAKPSEPDSKPQSSSEQSSSDSEPEVKKELNQDLLSDIGLTYSQLVEKHGKLIEAGTAEGGISYVFQNGYGCYSFLENSNVEQDDRENSSSIENVPKPTATAKCFYIGRIKASELFSGITFPLSLSELESTYKLDMFEHDTEPGMNDYYWSTFSYNGIWVLLGSKGSDTIDPDSLIIIRTPQAE